MPDKFKALWLSASSIADFQACPRAYFLKNRYRNEETGRKVQIVAPALSLGSAVHSVIEALADLPVAERFSTPLEERYDAAWKRVSGRRGGFTDPAAEADAKQRGWNMIKRVKEHPGPVARQAVRLKADLPWYWLSESDNIILCGRLDWLEYLPATDAIHIYDFKTGRNKVQAGALQLPIYLLLASHTQRRPVEGLSYWYLEQSDEPESIDLPTKEEAQNQIMAIAKQVKTAVALDRYKCPQGETGCSLCRPYEDIVRGKAELVYSGTSRSDRDGYILPSQDQPLLDDDIL